MSLVYKEGALAQALNKHAKEIGDIKFAVLSRAFLRGRKSTVLDVDLFVVGSVSLETLKKVVSGTEKIMEREVNFAVMGEQDFLFRKRKNDHFVSRILIQSRTMLIGDEEEFCSMT